MVVIVRKDLDENDREKINPASFYFDGEDLIVVINLDEDNN